MNENCESKEVEDNIGIGDKTIDQVKRDYRLKQKKNKLNMMNNHKIKHLWHDM